MKHRSGEAERRADFVFAVCVGVVCSPAQETEKCEQRPSPRKATGYGARALPAASVFGRQRLAQPCSDLRKEGRAKHAEQHAVAHEVGSEDGEVEGVEADRAGNECEVDVAAVLWGGVSRGQVEVEGWVEVDVAIDLDMEAEVEVEAEAEV